MLHARVAESADAVDSKSTGIKPLRVQVPPRAPFESFRVIPVFLCLTMLLYFIKNSLTPFSNICIMVHCGYGEAMKDEEISEWNNQSLNCQHHFPSTGTDSESADKKKKDFLRSKRQPGIIGFPFLC